MLTFKGFLKEAIFNKRPNKTIIGFASIHKHDTSDKELKLLDLLRHKLRNITGFASIHKNDTSDAALKDEKKKLKEDSQAQPALLHHNPLTGIDHYHQKYLDHRASMGSDREEREVKELAPFLHHHLLNNILSREQSGHINKYTRDSSDINQHLIHGHSIGSWRKETEKELSKHTKSPLNAIKHPTIVHSGVGEEMASRMSRSNIGDKVHMPAYTSTSTSPHIAKGFAHSDHNQHQHVLHFHLPEGYKKARHVSNISDHAHEREVIIHKGTVWKKVGHHIEPTDLEKYASYATIHHHHLIPSSRSSET